MSTMQYIGARYVPIFFENSETGDSTWAAGTIYEPLTIVTWNGNSYTSKKQVPASIGQPNLNLDYWAVTGQSSEQVEGLIEDVNDLSQRVDGIDEEIETMFSPSKPAGMKNVLFIGDSYCTRNSPNTIPALLAGYFGLASSEYATGASGSTGFGHVNESNENFYSLIQGVTHTFSNEDVTHIFFIGGANDSLETDNVITAGAANCCDYIASNYPNATVYLCFVGGTTDASKIVEYARARATWIDLANAYDHWVLANNVWMVMKNRSAVSSDGVHPASWAYTSIAKAIYKETLHSGTYHYYHVRNKTIGGTQTATLHEYMNDNIAQISTNTMIQIDYSTPQTISTNSRAEVADLTDMMMTGNYYEEAGTETTAWIITNSEGSDSEFAPAFIWLYNGKLYIRPFVGYRSVTMYKLLLPKFCITVDSSCV